MAAPALDRETILRAVQSWPVDEQIALAEEILLRAEERRVEDLPRRRREQRSRVSSSELRGLLANGQPAPSDEEVARWLDEERMKKYGG